MASTLRAPRLDELADLHALIVEIQRADDIPMVMPIEEVDEWFTSPDIDVDQDMRVVEVDGQLVAYGVVDHSPSGERLEKAVLFGRTHPDHRGRGHGRSILEWQMARGEEKLAATDPSLPAHLMVFNYEFESQSLDFVESHGFERARFDHELVRPLEPLPELIEPNGIRIEPWTDEHFEPSRRVMNESFADHWGSTNRSVERWRHVLDSHGARLDLSFVAVDATTGQVVGISLNAHYPEDLDVTGRLDGWIETLGTVRSHRKRGVASALLVRSLHAFASEGFDHAALGVDTENPSGAYGIYADLGFDREHTVVTMLRPVRPGA